MGGVFEDTALRIRMSVLTDDSERMKRQIKSTKIKYHDMRKLLSAAMDLFQLIFISIPLALTIYIGLHIGLLFYVIYKKIR